MVLLQWFSAFTALFSSMIVISVSGIDHLHTQEVMVGRPSAFVCLQNTKIRANFGCRAFAYAEGQAHRNAADLCVDLAQEISANFEVLPFAMASDSDNDAGASVASDPGSHGPPCRIAAVATAQQRESCHLTYHSVTADLLTSQQRNKCIIFDTVGLDS